MQCPGILYGVKRGTVFYFLIMLQLKSFLLKRNSAIKLNILKSAYFVNIAIMAKAKLL